MVEERFLLAEERIRSILEELKEAENCNEDQEEGNVRAVKSMPASYKKYFGKVADFLLLMTDTCRYVAEGRLYLASLEELKEKNHKLYEDILPEHYEESYGNPAFAVRQLGEDYGQLLSFLYAEMRSLIVFAYEKKKEDMVIRMELFLEVYGSFLCALEETGKLPEYESIREIVYFFISDYTREATEKKLYATLNPKDDFALQIMENNDLESPEFLYYFG